MATLHFPQLPDKATMRAFHLISATLLAGVLHLSPAIAADGPSATFTGKLPADQALLTAKGTQVTGALDWTVRRDGGMLVFDAPEGDARVAVVELKAPDAAAAAKAAMALHAPANKRAIKVVMSDAAREGWDEKKFAIYDVPPNERATLDVTMLRHGDSWTAVIVDGADQTIEKRSAAVGLMAGSVRPQGYQRESFAGRKAHPLDAARIEKLRAFLETAMKQTQVPGVGLALLDGGKVVYEGGIGVRELGKPAKVDASTLFMAASNTKGMSTLLLATLADEGKLRWDQPVTDIYPGFKLGDAATTAKVQVKHLVCACTGLPRQDLEWLLEFKNATPQSSMALLGTLQPTSGFGELYQYSNLMASAAGYIGGHLVHPDLELGKAYDKAMQERVFKPLGMRDATFDFAHAQRVNHARPHALDIDSKAHAFAMAPNYSIVPYRPAGGVWVSARDLIRYVQLEANAGKLPDGKQLVSGENLLARRKAQVKSGEDTVYGMGLETEIVSGVTVLRHGGSMFGYKSNFFLLPEAGVGLVLLTNSDEGGRLLRPTMRRLLEVLYDGKEEAAEDVQISAKSALTWRAAERKRYVLPAAKEVSANLAARYRNADLGQVSIRRKGADTVLDIGEWNSVVASRSNADGTVSLVTTTPGLVGFEFVIATKDGKRALVMRDGQHEYYFIEQREG
jgi:CubicO group peptidase (beta-lactamase class C family)